MFKTSALAVFSLAVPLSGTASEVPESATVEIREVPPYANAISMLRRVSHGLVYRNAVSTARENGVDLQLFTIDPAEEKWSVTVPATPPDTGQYGALVWIPSDDGAGVPASIRQAAADQGWIVISALESGEEQPLLERRLPLALIGTHWANKQYPIDKQRIVVGGEGEAAAVALQLAVGYADIYSGVVAVDGGVAIGSESLAVPVAPLPDFLRQRSDIVFVASDDSGSIEKSVTSFRDFCVAGTRFMDVSEGGHSSGTMTEALGAISETSRFTPDPDCVTRVNAERDAALAELEEIFENRRWRHARNKLLAAHFKYGGMVEEQLFRYADMYEEKYEDLYAEAAEFITAGPRASVLPDYTPPEPFIPESD